MPFKHGSKAEVWLDAVDVSQYFNDLGTGISVDTAETTTFKAAAKTFIEGDASSKIDLKGFYDLNIDAQLATALRNGGSVLTVGPAGMAAIGDLARLISVHTTDLAESSPVGGAVLMSFAAIGDGIVGFGQALHPLATDVNTTTGATKDDTASSATGWRAHLHVTGVTGGGSWIVKLQDASASNFSDGADVTGGAFTSVAGAASQRLVGASGATLRRYVRYVATRTGGAGGDSVTFGLAYSRQ